MQDKNQFRFYTSKGGSVWLWNMNGSVVRRITDKEVKKKMPGPIERKTVGYGENKVLSICKWKEGNITLEVRVKDPKTNAWETSDKINLFDKVQDALKELMD